MKQGTVILADSHQNMLGSIRNLLEGMFETVFMVADEASLIEAGTKLSPDLIVADLSLPVFTEVNVVRRLKKAFPGIKLIILSIHDEGSAVGECLVAGASGFVLKRTAVSDLVPAIETVLKGDLYMSPSVVQTSKKNGVDVKGNQI
ncbi:MAG: response regulator transcription factor [Nitrospirales bacterium]|nr:response regulator transcription factor [Nitrospirales bacterium]